MKKQIPNFFTCLNLFCGCVGLVWAFSSEVGCASYAILAAAFFDFADGMAARLLHVHAAIGKELDSLADMVSFGVLPSVIVFQLFEKSSLTQLPFSGGAYLPFFAFLIAIFSALRLAKFNVDPRQSDNFIGLPTPANALLVASLPLILASESAVLASSIIFDPLFLLTFTLGTSMLLIIDLPLLSLKFKNLKVADNLIRYVLAFSSLFLLIVFRFAAIPMIIFLYFILSIIQFRFIK